MEYVVQVLEALRIWEDYHLPPEQGGYLDQPLIFTRDLDAAHSAVRRHHIESVQSAPLMQEVLKSSTRPDIPLPPIPKELQCLTPQTKS